MRRTDSSSVDILTNLVILHASNYLELMKIRKMEKTDELIQTVAES